MNNSDIERLLLQRLGVLPRPRKPLPSPSVMDFDRGVDGGDGANSGGDFGADGGSGGDEGGVPPSLAPDIAGVSIDPASFILGVVVAFATIVFLLGGEIKRNFVAIDLSNFSSTTAFSMLICFRFSSSFGSSRL